METTFNDIFFWVLFVITLLVVFGLTIVIAQFNEYKKNTNMLSEHIKNLKELQSKNCSWIGIPTVATTTVPVTTTPATTTKPATTTTPATTAKPATTTTPATTTKPATTATANAK